MNTVLTDEDEVVVCHGKGQLHLLPRVVSLQQLAKVAACFPHWLRMLDSVLTGVTEDAKIGEPFRDPVEGLSQRNDSNGLVHLSQLWPALPSWLFLRVQL